MRLQGKVAIVTGGSRGIGRAIALRLGQEGAAVAVVHRSGGAGDEVAGLIRQAGGRMVKRTIFFRSEPQSPGTSGNCIDFCGDRLAGFDGYEASGIGCRILEGERQHLIDILLGEQLKGKSSGQVLQVQAGCQFERNRLLECVIFDRLSGFFQ